MIMKELPLGQIAFSNNRHSKDPKKNIEPNNEFENNLAFVLKQHFDGDGLIDGVYLRVLQKLLKNNYPEYNDIFKETENEKLYRGISINEKMLLSLNIITNDELNYIKNKKIDELFEKDIKIRYKHRTISASSWTSDFHVALSAANLDNDHVKGIIDNTKIFTIIFMAESKDNKNVFLQCKKGLYRTTFADGLEFQEEHIALQQYVNVSKIFVDRKYS